MATITFDTHTFVKKLKAVGFTEEQAEVFANEQATLIEDRLATKHDILLLEKDIKEIEANLRRDLRELEYRLTIKLGTLMVVAVGVVTTLAKLL